jgi:hypothetical protein
MSGDAGPDGIPWSELEVIGDTAAAAVVAADAGDLTRAVSLVDHAAREAASRCPAGAPWAGALSRRWADLATRLNDWGASARS